MTGSAVRAELATMMIIFLMTGITICGRALEYIVDVTRLAVDLSMFTLELERGQIVVELCGSPAFF